MKKALIVLLFLAVAGGLFAQGFTFRGYVNSGLYAAKYQDVDDIAVGLFASDANRGYRSQFQGAWVNEAKNAGFNFRLRAQGDAAPSAGDNAVFMPWAYGWISAIDGMITVYGGANDSGAFVALDKIKDDDLGEGLGLLTVVAPPIEGLKFALGAYAADNAALALNGEGDFTKPKGMFAAAYANETFALAFAIRNTNGVAGYVTAKPAVPAVVVDNPATAWDDRKPGVAAVAAAGEYSQAYLTFSYLGVENLHAAVTAEFNRIEEFGDYGFMRFYESFAWSGVENLNVGIAFQEALAQTEGADMFFMGWLWADYALNSGKIIPRLDAAFVMGGVRKGLPHFRDGIKDGYSWNADNKYMAIRPSCKFAVASNAWFNVGVDIGADMGDSSDSGLGKTVEKGTNFAGFLEMLVSF